MHDAKQPALTQCCQRTLQESCCKAMLGMTCMPTLRQQSGTSSVQDLVLLADDHHAALVRECSQLKSKVVPLG